MFKLIIRIMLIITGVMVMPVAYGQDRLEKAVFSGGCFWCVQEVFEEIEGVVTVRAGYIGGLTDNPSYADVSLGSTGHREAVEVTYDPEKVSYLRLLDVFWRNIDPTDTGGQFVDRGSQYTTAIFYYNPEQEKQAQESKRMLESSGIFDRPVVTQILKASKFYPAEEYHQDFYQKNPQRYGAYRKASGRDEYIFRVWGKESGVCGIRGTSAAANKSTESLKKRLTPLQYTVTQEGATERPFNPLSAEIPGF